MAVQILDPELAAEALESLAAWAGSLTAIVVLRPDEGLLLEVRGSLRYFSGLEAIRQRLLDEIARRGWRARLATAPTPLAASWIVRCEGSDVIEPGALAGVIGRLPLAATAWPERVQRTLEQMGLGSIADCLRLPRSGFARRIGQVWLDELDRALGRMPDCRTPHRPPETLSRVIELPLETSDRAVFAEALSGMAASLEHELRQRQAQVAAITLAFRHLRHDDTLTRMRFVEPVHERARLLPPLLARIERIALAAPAVALSLETSRLLPLRAQMPELLPPSPDDPEARAAMPGFEFALVERLRGRFGVARVYGIDTVAEHRPEQAWRHRPDHSTAESPTCPPHDRPLWLLPAPQKKGRSPLPTAELAEVSGCERGILRPSRAGMRARSLQGRIHGVSQNPPFVPGHPGVARQEKDSVLFFAEPERIESGWWDGGDVRRDYFVVVGSAGEMLWVYRDCGTGDWYLHGIFG